MRIRSFLLLVFVLQLGITSCTKKNRFAIDTDQSSLTVKIQRFDKDFLTLDTTNVAAGMPALQKKYPEFLPAYTQYILRVGTPDSANYYGHIKMFLTMPHIRDAYEESQRVFADVSDIENKLTTAFRYLQHYFPKMPVPQVYMHVSGFNEPIVYDSNILSASIDNYLGEDYIAYSQMDGFYAYIRYNMRREKVASDLVTKWISVQFLPEPTDILLNNMLHGGRIMYLLKTIMPGEKENVLMGYSAEQWAFCQSNEKAIWAVFLDGAYNDRLLFSNSRMNVLRYINPAPFSIGMPEVDGVQTPGQIGIWTGWQIVRQYMERNPEVTLPQLMRETDFQKILEGSKYRP